MESINCKVITAILPKGSASGVAKKLRQNKKLDRINMHHSRGSGMISPKGKKGIGQQVEKDVLSVIVNDDQADEIFQYIYDEAEMDRPHGGFLYQVAAPRSSVFHLPELPEED